MSGDFGGYKALGLQAAKEQQALRDQPLVDCPQCGEPLQVRQDGIKNCPLGHFRTRSVNKGVAFT